MGKMSRDKGKRGERTICTLFKDFGYEAHRTAQYRGNTGDAADIEGIPGLYIEVKFRERMSLYDWVEQAVHDAEAEGKENLPVVIHKANNKDTLVTMRFTEWIQLYSEWEAGLEVEDGKSV